MKKEFKKPIMAVLNAEAANIICGSGGKNPTIPTGPTGGDIPTTPQARQNNTVTGAPAVNVEALDF